MIEQHTRWYVTPLTKPERRLDGPYATREQCERRCIQIASDETKSAIVEALLESGSADIRFAVSLYMPSPVTLSAAASSIPAPVASAPISTPRYTPPSLLNKLKQLPRGKLMQIANVIGLSSTDHNKHALAATIFKTLKANATEPLLP